MKVREGTYLVELDGPQARELALELAHMSKTAADMGVAANAAVAAEELGCALLVGSSLDRLPVRVLVLRAGSPWPDAPPACPGPPHTTDPAWTGPCKGNQ